MTKKNIAVNHDESNFFEICARLARVLSIGLFLIIEIVFRLLRRAATTDKYLRAVASCRDDHEPADREVDERESTKDYRADHR